MKVKTSELTGAALDWAVAIAEGYEPDRPQDGQVKKGSDYRVVGPCNSQFRYSPSIDWRQGGPLLANLMTSGQWGITPFTDGQIMISNTNSDCLPYNGDWEQASINAFGDNLLIATCRAIVTSEIGEEVDIPDSLL